LPFALCKINISGSDYTYIRTQTYRNRIGNLMKHVLSFLAVGLVLTMITSCGSRIQSHGRLVEESQLASIEIGVSTKQDILFALGQPSFEGAFNSGKIYYNNQIMIKEVAGKNKVSDRTLFIFTFDNSNILKEIEVRDQSTDLQIAKIDKATPTPGENLSATEQILSNLRRRSDQ
jgi:outer membrane protein assembly factor BamE (lipoprotein component of BamABCDE complex)